MIKHRFVYPMRSSPQESNVPDGLISLLLGFFGVTAAFLLLPKTIKYVIRHFVAGIISEIVMVVLAGLLTEKLIDVVGSDVPESTGIESSP